MKWILLRLLYPSKTRVWVIGDDNAEFWRNFGLFNQGRVAFESPVNQDVRAASRRISGFGPTHEDHATALFLGRLAPEKRLPDAVRAVALTRDRGVDMRLVVVGEGDRRLLLLDGAVPHWLTYLGPLPHDDIGGVLAGCDVLVLPSQREAYGLVVREALQFGLPVVASTAVTAARELCDHGWNLVEVGDVSALSDALAKVARDKVRWPIREAISVDDFYRTELAQFRTGGC